MTEYNITGGNAEVLEIAKKNKNKLVVLDFGASWCGPCRGLAPVLHEIAEREDDLVLCTIDVDEEGNRDICDAYDVKALPTIVCIRHMRVVDRIQGADKQLIRKTCRDLCSKS